jgi:hypothetical protein
MTFEELQQIASEQETRTFSLECSLEYAALNTFCAYHFKELRQNYIHNACWEAILKTQFPFEQIVPHIEFVHTVSDTSGIEKVFTGVSVRFSLYILNSPEMTVLNLSVLITKFLTYFDDILTHFFKLPMEIKSSSIGLNLNRTHSLFQAVNKNKSF